MMKLGCQSLQVLLCFNEELQNFIDEVSGKFDLGRCFVRASGTEDLVRIYAESNTSEETDMITKLVFDFIEKNYS